MPKGHRVRFTTSIDTLSSSIMGYKLSAREIEYLRQQLVGTGVYLGARDQNTSRDPRFAIGEIESVDGSKVVILIRDDIDLTIDLDDYSVSIDENHPPFEPAKGNDVAKEP